MSYSHYAKNLLCGVKNRRKCCDTAMLYGLLINSNIFSGERIRYVTENEIIADKAESLINAVLNSNINIKFKKATHQTYQIDIADIKITGKLMKKFKYTGSEKDFRRINESIFSCDSCKGAFMRGIFISCGTASEPNHGYHLEISLNSERLAFEIKDLLKSKDRDSDSNSGEKMATEVQIEFKYIKRKKSHILYLKGSETIEDFLYYINAAKLSFGIMEVKILKEVRNNVNRVTNIENANLKKISGAAAEQIVAINAIIKDGRFESLPEELKQTAQLRLDNIELSLQEIGELSEPKLTKSGVNHRIKKLIEISSNTNGGK